MNQLSTVFDCLIKVASWTEKRAQLEPFQARALEELGIKTHIGSQPHLDSGKMIC